jgi:hypothetical protein
MWALEVKVSMLVERTQNTEPKSLRNCEVRSCEKISAALLHGQDLCLTHFLAKAYEYLESFDRRAEGPGGKQISRSLNTAEARSFVKECSIQALRVSLRSATLTNLERSRLLDILLWTGELSDRLRCQRSALNDRPTLASKLAHDGNVATPQG